MHGGSQWLYHKTKIDYKTLFFSTQDVGKHLKKKNAWGNTIQYYNIMVSDKNNVIKHFQVVYTHEYRLKS